MADPHLSTAGRAYQGQGSTGVAAIAEPPNPSCFGAIQDAAEAVGRARRRVEQLVERLAGVYPEVDPSVDKNPSNGLLSSANNHACAINVDVDLIMSACARLEKQLP